MMNSFFIDEPELDFGQAPHIDIRYGIWKFGTLDKGSDQAPRGVRLGVVGDQQSAEAFLAWLGKCRSGLAAKKSKLTTLFPAFPGFGQGKPFCDFVSDDRCSRIIRSGELSRVLTIGVAEEFVSKSVDLYLGAAEDLTQNVNIDVVACLLPPKVLKTIDCMPPSKRVGQRKLVWHDLLKARGIRLKTPLQMVRPGTYGGKIHRYRQNGKPSRDVEDEASRAWNFFSGLYYKAGGVPWRLRRKSSDKATCYVGISFFWPFVGEKVHTSVAQVFNERGEGVVVRGGPAEVVKDDRTVHITRQEAASTLAEALSVYHREHEHSPARVVIHKSTYSDEDEIGGFQQAAGSFGIDSVDIVSLRTSSTRLYRNQPYPPLRGTGIQISRDELLLYTQGSIDFYRASPTKGIPRALEVRLDNTEYGWRHLATEILGLSKMNWNSTRFANLEPISLAAARKVGNVLAHCSGGETSIPIRYSYYM